MKASLAVLVSFQTIVAATLWLIDPFRYGAQRVFGSLLAAELMVTSIVLYVYTCRDKDYDQEWIALGFASVLLICLLAYFGVGG